MTSWQERIKDVKRREAERAAASRPAIVPPTPDGPTQEDLELYEKVAGKFPLHEILEEIRDDLWQNEGDIKTLWRPDWSSYNNHIDKFPSISSLYAGHAGSHFSLSLTSEPVHYWIPVYESKTHTQKVSHGEPGLRRTLAGPGGQPSERYTTMKLRGFNKGSHPTKLQFLVGWREHTEYAQNYERFGITPFYEYHKVSPRSEYPENGPPPSTPIFRAIGETVDINASLDEFHDLVVPFIEKIDGLHPPQQRKRFS